MNPVDDFLEEKEKQSGWLSDIGRAFMRGVSGEAKNIPGMGAAVSHQLGSALPGVAMAGLIGGAGAGVVKGVSAISDKITKSRDYKAMVEANPMLRKEPAGHVQMMFNSLRSLAPSLSKEPLVAGSYVRQMLASSPESGPAVPIATAKLLVDSQKNMSGRVPDMLSGAFMRPSLQDVARPEREELPFTAGATGVSGRFKSRGEAEEFANAMAGAPSGYTPPRRRQ